MIGSITAYQGLAGDRNDLGISGARALGAALAQQLALPLVTVGQPAPALNARWQIELDAATPELRKLATHVASQFAQGYKTITVLNRCAAAIATIPCVAARHPDVCVVWLDAHADLNTPAASASGYLGGMALSGPAGLWDSGFGSGLQLSSIVLVGSRDIDAFEAELIASGTVRWVAADTPDIVAAVIASVAERPVYVHVDCDVLEPGLVPTDFRVAGGLTFQTLHALASALATTRLVGIEIAEFQSAWEPGAQPASCAGLVDALKPLLAACCGSVA